MSFSSPFFLLQMKKKTEKARQEGFLCTKKRNRINPPRLLDFTYLSFVLYRADERTKKKGKKEGGVDDAVFINIDVRRFLASPLNPYSASIRD